MSADDGNKVSGVGDIADPSKANQPDPATQDENSKSKAIDFTKLEDPDYTSFQVREKNYNKEKQREGMRGRIALGLLIGILALSAFPFVVLFMDLPPETRDAPWYSTLVESIDKSIAALVGIFGAVTGFYFGSIERAEEQKNK